MDPIKNALNQAGNFVQQAAHTVAEVFHISETTTDDVDKTNEKRDDDEDKNIETNIDSKQKKFEQEQSAKIQKTDKKTSSRAYEDKPQESDAKVLATSWPDLKGKTRHEAEEIIKAKGIVLKKGTSSTTEHDESRVILFVDDNDIVVEEPKVG
ncbi:unnamed protein product [Rotaria sp. Silwood2]|nr:unnamed protein product [Rotaria sp. Silwood2]CAF4269099.1 unnamed protein product [Rotaria sp. Silwood2]CAF4369392.1 unnamed protein product [Rotaria sp. Silwood2]CAF4576931.1 unnamed protein product [Rotaria sp. Silwood2]